MKKFLHVFFVAAVVIYPAFAQQAKVREIVVEGNKRIESSTIISNVKIKPGQTVDQEILDATVRELFDTGYFSDVNIHVEKGKAIVAVVENPIVNKIAFEGNKELSDKILKEIVRLKPRQIYTLTKLKNDTKTLHDAYRVSGYFSAQITPKVINREQNRVDVVFEIAEGEATKVEKIIFIGNRHFKDSLLERLIQTKESRWYRFFVSDDNYDPDRMAYDQELLRRFYLMNGYADFRVKSAVAELSPDQKDFFITFTLEEGERYRFADVEVDSKIGKVSADILSKQLTFRKGNWYDADQIERSIKRMTNLLGSKGYAFVDIKTKVDKSEDNKTVGIKFEVLEGPRVYIDNIIIRGNIVTDDDVIRREIRLHEGDAYNLAKLQASERRIRNLGFFKNVSIKTQPSDAPDKMNLLVEIEEEESMGELSIAGGYGTTEGLLGDVAIHQGNFLGRGQDVKMKFRISSKKRAFDVGFTEPYFLGKPLSAGMDVYAKESKKYFDSSFEHRQVGANLRLGYNIAEDLSQSWTYTLRSDKIKGISLTTSEFIREDAEEGGVTTSMISHNLMYDQRNSRFSPTSGYYVGTTNRYAGLGSSKVQYTKQELYGAMFFPIAAEWTLGFKARGGFVTATGGNKINGRHKVRINDRFTMGGGEGSMRGFEVSGVGTQDNQTKESLGALRYYLGVAELEFPLGLPNEFGIKGAVFAEVGSAWGGDEPSDRVFDSSSPRVSVGAGISVRTPFGPMRLDVAHAVVRENFDKRQTIHFGFSTRF